MTVTLIVISVTFLLLTSPFSVYITVRDIVLQDKDKYMIQVYQLVLAVLHLMWVGNNAVTFYLYCLTGTKYRKEFIKLFCKTQEMK